MRLFLAVSSLLLISACVAKTRLARTDLVVANDNRVPAGQLRSGQLEVELVATRSRWFPADTTDSSVTVVALGVEGGAPSVPGPLLRAALGSQVRMSVRNALRDTIALCPLYTVKCRIADAQRIAPGTTLTREFVADRLGATLYRAELVHGDSVMRGGSDSQMTGALIVDSSAVAPAYERVFVINTWSHPSDTNRFVQTLNGKTWPFTERLSLSVGDSTRWRLLNAGLTEHPMHLHGFYFRVDSRGDVSRDTLLVPDQRELAVTENLRGWGVATISWTPTRGGNWLFHCHKTAHMSGLQHYQLSGLSAPEMPLHTDAATHALRAMGGLIIGVEVAGDPKADLVARSTPSASPRRLRLSMNDRPKFYRGREAGYLFALDGENGATSAAAGKIPGPLLVLRRGEPVEIAVVNRLGTSTTVHWHGIELESFFDGVAGWSGARGSLTPMIAPSDSFVARFTPPRSGTFMYHAHVNEERQLTSGLYAPMVVLDSGATWNPERDHILMFSQAGPDFSATVVVNGLLPAAPLRLTSNTPHRLRLINITAMDEIAGELTGGTSPQSWRVVAKDGATIPAARALPRPAKFHLGPGEIMDVEVNLRRGNHELKVHSFNDFAIPVRVP